MSERFYAVARTYAGHMTDSDPHPLAPAFGKRAEFAALARDEGRRLNERESNLLSGAMNLLDKALTRESSGERAKADRLISRAAAMSYDARMEGSPGIRGACQLLYELVTDWFEESDMGDLWWLEVVTTAHRRLEGAGQDELASTVHGFVLQPDVYETSSEERRLIRAEFGHAPLEADLGDRPDQTPEAREAIIRSVLAAIRVLEEEAQRTG